MEKERLQLEEDIRIKKFMKDEFDRYEIARVG